MVNIALGNDADIRVGRHEKYRGERAGYCLGLEFAAGISPKPGSRAPTNRDVHL